MQDQFEKTIVAPEHFMRRSADYFRRAASFERLAPCPWYLPNPWHIPIVSNLPRPGGLIQTEFEVSLFLFALVLMLKPRLVVETGTDTGCTARALGAACAANGFGKVITCDIDADYVAHAIHLCEGLPVECRLGPALQVVPEIQTCDLLFSDSSYDSRAQEVRLLKVGAYGVLHDTGIERILHDAVAHFRRVVYFPTPRGLALFQQQASVDPVPELGVAFEYEGLEEKMRDIAAGKV